MTEIQNCLITQSNAKVLKEYCIDKSNPLYKQYKSFNTSVNLSADKVYNRYSGKVSFISGDARRGYEVGILVNANQAIKYSNLKSVAVTQNQIVDISDEIGEANKYVAVEYMTTYVKNQYSYRVGNIQMYKDDPMKIIDVDSTIVTNPSPQYSETGLYSIVDEYDGGINLPDDFTINGIRSIKR